MCHIVLYNLKVCLYTSIYHQSLLCKILKLLISDGVILFLFFIITFTFPPLTTVDHLLVEIEEDNKYDMMILVVKF